MKRETKDTGMLSEQNVYRRINTWLADRKNYTMVYLVLASLSLVLLCAAVSGLDGIHESVTFQKEEKHLMQSLWNERVIVTVWLAIIAIGYFIFSYRIEVSFSPINTGQHGTQRWTTRDEIASQYRLIPEKDKRYPGNGGVPIARCSEGIFIDDSPVNNLIIGITRSGKGELVVFPEIDIYSRAAEQASLIITDPKLELASASIPRLTSLGYECHVLNIIDPDYSMGYNPLALMTEEYKAGHTESAKLLCGTFCYSIFNPDKATGDSVFWQDISTSLLSALILATIDDNLKADRILNIKRRREFEDREKQRLEKALNELSTEDRLLYLRKEALNELRKSSPYISDRAAGRILGISEEEAAVVRSSTLPSVKYSRREYKQVNPNEKNINMFSILNTFTVLTSKKINNEDDTAFDDYFRRRPEGDTARLLYTGTGISADRTKGSVYSNMLTALKVFTYPSVGRMTAESTLDIKDIGFGTKPVAVFIGLPDYDQSNWFLATVFIRQIYFILAKMAEHAPGLKCGREVVFLLDEFGNIPPVENLGGIITVCLSRNIRFNLVIQSFSQLEGKYGEDDSSTIMDNCGNKIYIQATKDTTAEKFAKDLGNETRTSINRTGKQLSLFKEQTEMPIEHPLIDAASLKRLKPGETIVDRTKRRDLSDKGITPFPIDNRGEYRMKHRFEYLLEYFPSGNILYTSPDTLTAYEMAGRQKKAMADDLLRLGMKVPPGFIPDIYPKSLDIPLEITKHINLRNRLWDAAGYNSMLTLMKDYMTDMDLSRLAVLGYLGDNDRNEIAAAIYYRIVDDIENERNINNALKAYSLFLGEDKTESHENVIAASIIKLPAEVRAPKPAGRSRRYM